MPDLIRFVYFDLDDTLLDHRHAERCALADVVGRHADAFAGVDLATIQEQYHAHNVPLWRSYSLGEIEKADLRRLRFERLLDGLGLELDPDETGAVYMQCYHDHWTYIDGARDAFEAVANRYPVGILTNGFAEVQHAKLDRFPILRARSRAVVISEEVGYMKPHPKLFAHATALAGCDPASILYVGDSYHSDVAGGRASGWQVAWYRPGPTDAPPDGVFCFDQWDALLDRLGV